MYKTCLPFPVFVRVQTPGTLEVSRRICKLESFSPNFTSIFLFEVPVLIIFFFFQKLHVEKYPRHLMYYMAEAKYCLAKCLSILVCAQ